LPEAPSWRGSAISPLDRSRRLRQSATLVLVSGENEADVAEMTRGIEAGLFAGGLLVYGLHLGLEERAKPEPAATVAWLSSVAGPLIDAGMILVAGVPRLSDDLAQRLESAAGAQRCLRLWVGGGPGIGGAQRVALDDPPETVAARLKPELTERNSTHEED